MLVRLKFRMYAAGVVYEQGVQEIPDGTPLPSTATILTERPPEVEKESKEPETLSDLLPKTKQEMKK